MSARSSRSSPRGLARRPTGLSSWCSLGGPVALLVASTLVQPARCLGTVRACEGVSPALVVENVLFSPAEPRPGQPQKITVKGHVATTSQDGNGSIDFKRLHATVRVLFCDRDDDCLQVHKLAGLACSLAVVSGPTAAPCPVLHPGEAFSASSSAALPEKIIRGGYQVELGVHDSPEAAEADSRNSVACYLVANVIVSASTVLQTFEDYRDACVAFGVAASASRALGKHFPAVSHGLLPQITGFLLIGIVVGPFVTNLVTHYHIFLIGRVINRVSLAFIAGAAGAEIFLPELMTLLAPMMLQVAFISICTLCLCTMGLLILDSTALVALPMLAEQKSFAAKFCVSLLAGSLMTARSPASVIAVMSEMHCTHLKPCKVILGITVLGDVIVLVLFAVCTNLTRVVTEGGTFGLEVLLGVFLEIMASIGLGVITGFTLRLFLPYREPAPLHDHTKEIPQSNPHGDHHGDLHGDHHRHEQESRILVALRGFVLLAILFGTYILSESMGEITKGALNLEPLLACTVASCLCGQDRGRREALEEAISLWTPVILLPFFTLAGASLQLRGMKEVLPGAFALVLMRMVSIAVGGVSAGAICARRDPDLMITGAAVRYTWLTLLAQAGVTLGLVLEVQHLFEGWGMRFGMLVIGVVVINQLLGPVLCRVGLIAICKAEDELGSEYASLALTHREETEAHDSSTGGLGLPSMLPTRLERVQEDPVTAVTGSISASKSFQVRASHGLTHRTASGILTYDTLIQH